MLRMGSISRYIFRTTLGAFLVVLVSLTAVIWVTQALRDIDIMTNQGQTILVFIGITGLIIPLLVLVIAPIALLIAVAHVLNKLSNEFRNYRHERGRYVAMDSFSGLRDGSDRGFGACERD